MTNAILVLAFAGLIGTAAAAGYQREGDFHPHQGGGDDHHGGDHHDGPPGPPFGGRGGKFVLIKQVMDIHSTVCFGLPGPNFSRPDNNNDNNRRRGPPPPPPPKNVTDEEARLVRVVARLAETFQCKNVTDADCADLTAAEQSLIDFRRNNSIPCGEEDDHRDNHEFGRPPFGGQQQQGPQQGPRGPPPGNFNGNNNGGARGSSFAQQQQGPQPPRGPPQGNNFQPNNNNMHMMQQMQQQQRGPRRQ